MNALGTVFDGGSLSAGPPSILAHFGQPRGCGYDRAAVAVMTVLQRVVASLEMFEALGGRRRLPVSRVILVR